MYKFIFWRFFLFFLSCLVTLVIHGIWWIISLPRHLWQQNLLFFFKRNNFLFRLIRDLCFLVGGVEAQVFIFSCTALASRIPAGLVENPCIPWGGGHLPFNQVTSVSEHYLCWGNVVDDGVPNPWYPSATPLPGTARQCAPGVPGAHTSKFRCNG